MTNFYHKLVDPDFVRYSLALWCVPLLFCMGITHQVYHVVHNDLSVWKGGGMGMFSTLDHPSKRSLFLYRVTDTGERVRLHTTDEELTALLSHARVLPSQTHIRRVFDILSNTQWRLDPLSPDHALLYRGNSARLVQPTGVTYELELYKMTDVDHHANTVQVELVNVWSS